MQFFLNIYFILQKTLYQSIPFYSNSIFSVHRRLAPITVAFDVGHNIPTYPSMLISNGDRISIMEVTFFKPTRDVCFLIIVCEV